MKSTPSRQPTQNTTDIKPAAYSPHMTNKQSAPTLHNKTSTNPHPAENKILPIKTTRTPCQEHPLHQETKC